MGNLRELAKYYQSDLQDGIRLVAFWREKGKWQAEDFFIKTDKDDNDYLLPHDIERIQEILQKDPNAVILNGCYSGKLGDMTVSDIIKCVRWHYKNAGGSLKNFLESFAKEKQNTEQKKLTAMLKDIIMIAAIIKNEVQTIMESIPDFSEEDREDLKEIMQDLLKPMENLMCYFYLFALLKEPNLSSEKVCTMEESK